MCMNATAKIINTCFRRGDAINFFKYKTYARVAAVVSFGDLILRYFGREKISQAFEVNSSSHFMRWWTGKKEEFQNYIKNFNIEIDRDRFKTPTFKKQHFHLKLLQLNRVLMLVYDLLVFIDFVLFKLRAHRHVLFNIDKIKYNV
ncbi:unnamed protein product [Rotaria sp. Silwood1]|nr:unnamed protein product [Rotaria sp. Silwood1]